MTARLPFKAQITRRRRPDGAIWYAKASGRPVFTADGRFLGYRGASTNVTAEVTAREEAELAHRRLLDAKRQSDEALALLDTMLSAAPLGFAFLDRELRYVRVNEALAASDGLSASAHVGRTIEEVVPDLWRQLQPLCAQVLETRAPVVNFEISGETPARPGELRHWLMTFYPVFVGETVIGTGIVAIEVSEQRRTEAQLRQAQKMEAIGNLSGGMAHDFNNLLGVVIGNLDLLCDSEGVGGEVLELAREARDAALRGADLTRRLLAFARRQPLQPRRVDPNELVAGAVKLLRPLLGEHIEIALDLGRDLWPVVTDAAQLEASLVNLATNARDAMPGGGTLGIATRNAPLDADYTARHPYVAEGDYVLVEVSDTGTGMPPDVASRVFEPFFTTKEQGKGTGLGLSMVFGFMKQSGGHINVYSEVAIGSTFRLYFPRAEAGEAAAESGRADEPALRGANEAVLVVEDNAALRRVALRQVAELGYRVREAASAQAALESIALDPAVDLLFTDVVMPGGMDGRQLAEIVRRRWPHIKVLLTSGFPGSVVSTEKAGPPLLNKPYRKDELARALREVLERGAR
jgi:signal transduction histidine kinase/CheY-like chemotaxis protein